LESVLAVGNAMNAGTYNESSGFTLDSLLKLTQVKGNDKKTTVLDYVTRHVDSKHGKACLEFTKELINTYKQPINTY